MFTARNFLKAAERGDTDAVRQYLQREPQVCLAARNDGNTALHLAAQEGHTETVEALIQAGFPVDATCQFGYTPLALAVLRNPDGAKEIVAALLKAGADPNAEMPNDESILSLSLNRHGSNTEIARLLLDAKADVSKGAPLLKALEKSAWKLAGDMIDAGANPNARASNGYRPLHYAAMHGQLDLAQALLDKGADINARADYRNTALHSAINAGEADIVKLLIDRGARVDILNSQSQDALECARRSNHAAAIVPLIEPHVKKIIASRTTPLNATATELPLSDAEAWVLMGEEKVARVSVHPALLRRLTEVFNFESRERFTISENLRTQAETVTQPMSFDATPEGLLDKALRALRDLGGKADDEAVFGARLAKKTLKPQAGNP